MRSIVLGGFRQSYGLGLGLALTVVGVRVSGIAVVGRVDVGSVGVGVVEDGGVSLGIGLGIGLGISLSGALAVVSVPASPSASVVSPASVVPSPLRSGLSLGLSISGALAVVAEYTERRSMNEMKRLSIFFYILCQ